MDKVILANNASYDIALSSPIGKLAIAATIANIGEIIANFTEENLTTVILADIDGNPLKEYKSMYLANVIMPNEDGVAFFCLKQRADAIIAQQEQELADANATINVLNAQLNNMPIYQDGYEAAKILLGEG